MKFSHMRIWQGLAIAAIICAFSSVALANDFAINWNDPYSNYNSTIISSEGVTTTFQLGYPNPDGQGCPADQAVSSSDLCAAFYNETGVTLTSIELQFTVADVTNNPLIGQSIGCTSGGTSLFAANNCSDYSSLTSGEMVTLFFTGGNWSPDATLFLDLSSLPGSTGPSDFGNPSVTVGVPEPSSLLLLVAGLGFLALFGAWQKRAKDRLTMPERARMG